MIVDTTESPERTLQNCWRLQTAAAAVDAIAVEIFHAGNLTTPAASIDVLRDHFVTKKDVNIPRVANEAFRVRGYRDSLFFHLRRNFGNKFPTADILRFQRSTGRDRVFGDDYFFEVEIGRDVFGDDSAWDGFEKEIRLANLNMSVIDAQLVPLIFFRLADCRNCWQRGNIWRLPGMRMDKRLCPSKGGPCRWPKRAWKQISRKQSYMHCFKYRWLTVRISRSHLLGIRR